MTNDLKQNIQEIQNEYLSLLTKLLPVFKDRSMIIPAVDEIVIFWRSKRKIIEAFFKYEIIQHKTVFYSPSSYLDIGNNEHLFFLSMGNFHIYDDPLELICETCFFSKLADVFLEKISEYAQNNISILKSCNEFILIIPLRILKPENIRKQISEMSDKAFLDMFIGLSSIEEYHKKCKDLDKIVQSFNTEIEKSVLFYPDDCIQLSLKDRIRNCIEETKNKIGGNCSDSVLFQLSVMGTILRTIDIIDTWQTYKILPLISSRMVLNYFLTFVSLFKKKFDDDLLYICCFNSVYRWLQWPSLFIDIQPCVFRKIILETDFERNVLDCCIEGKLDTNRLKEYLQSFELLFQKKLLNMRSNESEPKAEEEKQIIKIGRPLNT